MTNDNKKIILVIDDNKDLNNVLVDKFIASGFDAKGAFDGEEGLKKALEIHPDVIMLDLVMPKMDGISMLKALRSDTWGKECKVMVLTLLEEPNYVAQTMEYNISGYIVKTNYKLDDIVKQVEAILSTSESKFYNIHK